MTLGGHFLTLHGMADGGSGHPGRRPSIPASYTLLLAQELDLGSRDLEDLLAGSGVDAAGLRDGGTLLTPQQQVALIDRALDLPGSAGLGFRLGRRLTIASHGPLGFLISTSPDLRTALTSAAAYAPTRLSFLSIDVEEDSSGLTLTARFDVEAPDRVHRSMAEALSMAVFDLVAFILGRPAGQIAVEFPHEDPGEESGVLPGAVSFGSKALRFRVPRDVCAAPNASANHAMHAMARTQCEALLAELDASGSAATTRAEVERLMLSAPGGALGEEAAAGALFISPRTLARRLAAEGTSFREVRDDLLARRAAGHLRDGMPVAQVAALLGYHDASGFRRAFKRWHGTTPEVWRRTPTASS